MAGKLYVGTDKEEFRSILDALTGKGVRLDRASKIISKYSGKYGLEGKVATIMGKRVSIDYLPTVDAMLEAKARYERPSEVVGSALFKIELDHCIFLTDSGDPNLRMVYESCWKDADELAGRLWKINTEEFVYQWTHEIAAVLSGSFSTVFGQSYGDWRRSI